MNDEDLDYYVENSGSIVTITPQSDAAKEWIDENVHTESWQWLGRALGVEARYAGDLLYGMQEAGLTSNVTVVPS
jgi:hypothetical protein